MWNNPTIEIERELSAGERLLWSGQPRRGLRLQGSDAFAIPFSVLWCGFAVFWEVKVITTGAPIFFMLWGIPFVLVGLYVVFGRFIVDARSRERTFYGVTNERIIIVSGLFSRQTKSLPLRALAEITMTERRHGAGTITFGAMHPMGRWLPIGWPGAARHAAPSFDLVERAEDVYELVRSAHKATT